jgi:hypothetical protein
MMALTRILALTVAAMSVQAQAHICEDGSFATPFASSFVERINPFPDQPELWVDSRGDLVLSGSRLNIEGKMYDVIVDECPRDRGYRVFARADANGTLQIHRSTYNSDRSTTPLFLDYEFEGQRSPVQRVTLDGTRVMEIHFRNPLNTSALKGYVFPVTQVRFYDSGEVQAFSLAYEGRANRTIKQGRFKFKICPPIDYEWTYLHQNGLYHFGRCSRSEDNVSFTYKNQKLIMNELQFYDNGRLKSALLQRKPIRATPIDENSPILASTATGEDALLKPGQVFFARDGQTVLQGTVASKGFEVTVQNKTARLVDYARGDDYIEHGRFDFYDNGVLRFGDIEPEEFTTVRGQKLTCMSVGFFKNGDLALCGMPEGKEMELEVNGHMIPNVRNVTFYKDGSVRQIQSKKTAIEVQGQSLALGTGDFVKLVIDPRSILQTSAEQDANYEPHLLSGTNRSSFQVLMEFYPHQTIQRIEGFIIDGLYSLKKSDGEAVWVGRGTTAIEFDPDGRVERVGY